MPPGLGGKPEFGLGLPKPDEKHVAPTAVVELRMLD
jgi:hypothetical protein